MAKPSRSQEVREKAQQLREQQHVRIVEPETSSSDWSH